MNITKQIDSFVKLVNDGVKKWQQAGALLVQMAEADPNIYTKITQKHAFISLDMLMAFEKIGRKDLHPLLLMSDSLAYRKTALLPYSRQKEVIESGVFVLDAKTGRANKKTLDDLTTKDISLAFSDRSIRSVEDQKLVYKEIEKCRENMEQLRSKRYSITGDSVTFFAACTFSRGELEAILEEWPKTNLQDLNETMSNNQIHGTKI